MFSFNVMLCMSQKIKQRGLGLVSVNWPRWRQGRWLWSDWLIYSTDPEPDEEEEEEEGGK